MTKLTEHTVLARTRAQDLKSVRKLNAWGSELTDVSIVKKLPNVEVLSLSVNCISTLEDFSHCHNLQELYIRKNSICELGEIRHLRDLSKLRNLWLADNPCAEGEDYRLTVIRALPQLQKLDNLPIRPDEVESAKKQGPPLELLVPSSPEPEEPFMYEESHSSVTHTESFSVENSAFSPSTPNNGVEIFYTARNVAKAEEKVSPEEENCVRSAESSPSSAPYRPPEDPEQEVAESSHYPPRCGFPSPYAPRLRCERPIRLLPKGGKSRAANILSAVLCLIKELDWASLEVVDTAIHCQMEEMEEQNSS